MCLIKQRTSSIGAALLSIPSNMPYKYYGKPKCRQALGQIFIQTSPPLSGHDSAKNLHLLLQECTPNSARVPKHMFNLKHMLTCVPELGPYAQTQRYVHVQVHPNHVYFMDARAC